MVPRCCWIVNLVSTGELQNRNSLEISSITKLLIRCHELPPSRDHKFKQLVETAFITPASIESPAFVISIEDEKGNKILETLSYKDGPSQFTQQFIGIND
jgi:hypothetical protein